jgi:hypothetical protein
MSTSYELHRVKSSDREDIERVRLGRRISWLERENFDNNMLFN